ncbi:hypothetical protein GLOTRDRAFT_41489, partial [Gloeophyllum trabeum ATCC 11539]
VVMRISNTVHYSLNVSEGAQEFSRLLPPSGHLIHLDDANAHGTTKNYTVTLFHQLRCLDIIRREYVRTSDISRTPSTLTHHCMNYLRQTILCHPNLRLESARYPMGPKSTTTQIYDAVCNDWREVYADAKRNHKLYGDRRAPDNTS